MAIVNVMDEQVEKTKRVKINNLHSRIDKLSRVILKGLKR
jgi:hypothetical protein